MLICVSKHHLSNIKYPVNYIDSPTASASSLPLADIMPSYHPHSPQAYACSVAESINYTLPAVPYMISMRSWNSYDLAEAFRIVQGRMIEVTAQSYCLSSFHWVANIRQKWCHLARADPFAGLEYAHFAVVQILLLDICRDYLDLT